MKFKLTLFAFFSLVFSYAGEAPFTISITKTNVDCYGASNGTINVAIVGGTAPFTYTWSKSGDITFSAANTSSNLTGLGSGTYNLVVDDADGDTQNAPNSIVISEPSPMALTYNTTNVSCHDGNDGAIDVFVAGGSPPYTYQWIGTTTATTEDISGLTTGAYQVVVTDANDCSITTNPIQISEPPNPVSATFAVEDVSCNAGQDGNIAVTPTGGTEPYHFEWTSSTNNILNTTAQNLTDIKQGDYVFEITDANDCVYTSNLISVSEPTILTAFAVETDVLCNGDNTGDINLDVSGGTLPYSFNWVKIGNPFFSSADEDLFTLEAGIYEVTITDANNCSFPISNITIDEPSESIIIGYETTDIDCNGSAAGQINITATGGTFPYFYQWSGDSFASTEDLSGVPAGTYNLQLTDANGCIANSPSITITEPASPLGMTVDITNVDCNGGTTGSVDVTITGGTAPYEYSWQSSNGIPLPTNTEDLTNIPQGNYALIVTDANACQITNPNINLTEPTAISASYTQVDILCHEAYTGSVDVTVSGGVSPYLFTWSKTGEPTFGFSGEDLTNINAGIYEVWITDSNGCTFSIENISITEPSEELSATASHVDILCNGDATGSIDVTVTGGTAPYAYQWSGSSSDISRDLDFIPAGTYNLRITDANACIINLPTVLIMEPQALGISHTQIDVLPCKGDATASIDVTVSGGMEPYVYHWETDASINLPTSNEDLTELVSGNYDLTVTDANACTIVLPTVSISEPATLLQAAYTQADVICYGYDNASIDVTVTGGLAPYFFQWSGASTSTDEDLEDLVSGVYDVRIMDSNGCVIEMNSITITEPLPLHITSTLDNISCHDDVLGAVDVTVSGGTAPYAYQWGGDITAITEDIQNLPVGEYDLTVTDANGCFGEIPGTAAITEPAPLEIYAFINHADCYATSTASIDLTIAGGEEPYAFEWAGSSMDSIEDLTNIAQGSYQVTVTDDQGCRADTTIIISQPDTLTISTDVRQVLCNGTETGYILPQVNGGTPPYIYQWFGDSNSSLLDLVNLPAGTYTLEVTDANGCMAAMTEIISEPTAIELEAGITDESCSGTFDGAIDLTVSGGTLPYDYEWNSNEFFNVTTEDLDSITVGDYTIYIVDANDCFVEMTYSVIDSFPYCEGPVIYNVISPDGDGLNDGWVIDGLEFYPDNDLAIYNRQGQIVWETASYDNADTLWEGTDLFGNKLPDGTYFYVFKVEPTPFFKGKLYKGWVQILR